MSDATDAMFAVINLADGLNDDLVVERYNLEYHDTIGVPATQDKYALMVYDLGYYNERDSMKIVSGRVTTILHELAIIAEAVIDEAEPQAATGRTLPKPQRSQGEAEAIALQDIARGLKEFASRCRNDTRRNSIYAAIAKANSVPPDTLDTSDTIISLPEGSLIIDYGKTITYDPNRHPEALNTMITNVPYAEGTGYEHIRGFFRELLSYTIRQEHRTDTMQIEAEERLLRALFGYFTLIRGNPEQIITIFSGSGGSGKTSLAEIIAEMAGTYAIASRRDLVVRTENDRIRADIGVVINYYFTYADELRPGDMIDTGQLKYLTNHKVMVEVKHKNPYQRLNNVKVLIVSNHDNRLDGQDDSIERRLITMSFYRPRPQVEDKNFAKKYVTENGPALLNYAIDGLRDVFASGGILAIVPDHIKKGIHDKLVMQDRAAMYLDEHLPKSVDTDTVLLTDAWQDFVRYYTALGETPPVRVSNRFGSFLRTYKYETYVGHGHITKIRGATRIPFISLEADREHQERAEAEKTFVSQQERVNILKEIIRKLEKDFHEGAAPIGYIETLAVEKHIERYHVLPELRVLLEIGEITETRPGYYKLT